MERKPEPRTKITISHGQLFGLFSGELLHVDTYGVNFLYSDSGIGIYSSLHDDISVI